MWLYLISGAVLLVAAGLLAYPLQLAVVRGKLAPEDVPELRQMIAAEFPSGDTIMNREIIRLAGALQVDSPESSNPSNNCTASALLPKP